MAFHILMFKKEENEISAQYLYMSTTSRHSEMEHGLFEINKENGDVTLVRLADYDEQKHFFQRASFKIFKHWKNGELPEEAEWAS
ncbi:hypothetical protein [Xenorhabdus griffiniae]|uniref:Uncharacterized protein n=1 Tax=Xenorhabdus griffiniae TaxID=351672 RepID=A0ABY9XFU5_9GAMM|nr:hypothetical protein [Xenorhabdus griffiniae]MBD1229605.1 hypothetical protein [Xenorhabdus griffiniae]MBE8589433.1 hypothetical protein [Xenorhabdus griffiniae]WMV71774.1 hypothetical protein QL128_16820 [Xenorhabdus griffiniae]WMV71780.1 hypothetical protein QL128_16855 [Xenorhabdus griffiniae]WNH01451.1 hypothetical protein QL112_016825 [Xenorhabdus griffiniae]